MAVTNTNLVLIDRPAWEQLTSAPANSAAASAFVDDNERFAYILFSAASFWRYDAWADTWQQLASPPGGTLAAGACLRYVRQIGTQLNGKIYGSVFALMASGTAVFFYRYDIATNTWSAGLSVTNLPAAWGTDGRLLCPEPDLNAFGGGYHSAAALDTVTVSADAAQSATTISVSALPLALPAGAVLSFGSAAVPVFAVTTAAAAAGATSITVSPLIARVVAGATAYWYADMFLVGNNATVMYRYNFVANAWYTTAASGAAIPAVPAAVGAGVVFAWLPGSGNPNALDRLLLLRGGASASIYEYSLSANSWSTVTYYPATETFTTGTSSGVRRVDGQSATLLINKDTTGRIYEFDHAAYRMTPKATQNLIAEGTALVGDKCFVLQSSDGIEFVYKLLSTSAYFLRTGLFF